MSELFRKLTEEELALVSGGDGWPPAGGDVYGVGGSGYFGWGGASGGAGTDGVDEGGEPPRG